MKPLMIVVLVCTALGTTTANGISPATNEGRIIVMVTDGTTRQVLENAQIIIEPGGRTIKTNAEGIAEIQVPATGTYVLYISATGYNRMQAMKVKVSDNLPTGISTSLLKQSAQDSSDVEAPSEGTYFLVLDTMPAIVGGMNELARILVYPEMAQLSGIEGTVFVRIYVSETGVVSKTVIEKSASPILDRAALDAVMKIGFTPAKKSGKNVKSIVIVPIRFRISK